jgi:hypothetical protein
MCRCFQALAPLIGFCGSGCGLVCLASGCCGSTALFSIIGLYGSTFHVFGKLTPVFFILTFVPCDVSDSDGGNDLFKVGVYYRIRQCRVYANPFDSYLK